MPRPALALIAAALALAACATPQQACIATVTQDLRTLDRLIAETEGNIARGYALQTVQDVSTAFVPCQRPPQVVVGRRGRERVVYPPPGFCWRDQVVTRAVPRAIDVAAERRILASSRAERARKARAAEAAIAQCRLRYPEG